MNYVKQTGTNVDSSKYLVIEVEVKESLRLSRVNYQSQCTSLPISRNKLDSSLSDPITLKNLAI